MTENLVLFSFVCDILVMSLFIWHLIFRVRPLNKEVHAINERTQDCPYKKVMKRVK
jgi:hypothetical protein